MLQNALERWAARFDGPPTVVSQAPGRVNLIGEHTDYNEGLVLPAAIDLNVVLLGREADEDDFVSVQVPDSIDYRGPGWRRYAQACRAALEARGLKPPPIQAVVDSNLPGGSGLSSSAALELAFLACWNQVGGLGLSSFDLAEVAWQAETEFVGVKVGRMDQMASSMGVEGSALFIDMRTLESRPCRLPDGVEIVILDTRKPRALAASKYNERVEECARAAAAIGVPSLRDASLEALEGARLAGLDDVGYRRARHVVTENGRVIALLDALDANNRRQIGRLLAESHESLRGDYEVTVPELDDMVRSARMAPGCIGARMTGAGFGGCCVALIETGSFQDFKAATTGSYDMYGYVKPDIFAVTASAGASCQWY
ncbi:MAG: galactokinase [Fimbriimonadales bacterium]